MGAVGVEGAECVKDVEGVEGVKTVEGVQSVHTFFIRLNIFFQNRALV